MNDEEKKKSNNDNPCDHITICKVGFRIIYENSVVYQVSFLLQNIA